MGAIMARTAQAMGKNDPDAARLAVPVEYGRAEWSISHAPSATALKALSVIFSHAGGDLSRMIEVPMPALRSVPGVSGMSASQVADMLRSLMVAFLSSSVEVRPGVVCDRFGPILGYAEIERGGDNLLALRVQFGPAFVKLAAESDVYALLDRALLAGLKSRYSILLYQYLATHWRKSGQAAVKLTVDEWRKVFALSGDLHSDFRQFNRKVFMRSVDEVAAVGPFALTVRREYSGRAVSALVVSWHPKDDAQSVDVRPAPKRKHVPSKSRVSVAPSAPLASDLLAALADRLNSGRYVAPSEVSTAKAAALLAAGLVTADVLRARGIAH